MAEPDLNDLAVFVRVAERQAFAKVARDYGVPTSTISRTVARLEQSIGTRLFQRTTRSLRLTDAGNELFRSVAPAVATLREAARSADGVREQPQGRLRVTMANDLGATVFGDVIVDFVARYPQVDVELELTARTVNLIEEGFDVALRAGHLKSSSLVARKIVDLEAQLFAAPAYLQRFGCPADLRDLQQHACVLFRARDRRATWVLAASDKTERVEVRGRIGCDDFAFARSAVLAGGGIGLIPRALCTNEIASGRLVRVLPPWCFTGPALYLVYPTARHLPAKVSVFRDFLVERLAPKPRTAL
jgi:DNA-binding transcriptional LysR family regulator